MMSHIIFVAGQISQNSWMAANVQNPHISTLKLISVYIIIGVCTMFFMLSRSLVVVVLGIRTSRSLFSQLLNSLFHAPMSFFDSTPLGRVLSRVRILNEWNVKQRCYGVKVVRQAQLEIVRLANRIG